MLLVEGRGGSVVGASSPRSSMMSVTPRSSIMVEGRGGSVLDGMSSSSSFMASAKVEPLGSQSSSEVEGWGSVSLIHVHL